MFQFTTFSLISSKHNIILAWNFAEVMNKIWAFLWYQHLKFDGKIKKWSEHKVLILLILARSNSFCSITLQLYLHRQQKCCQNVQQTLHSSHTHTWLDTFAAIFTVRIRAQIGYDVTLVPGEPGHAITRRHVVAYRARAAVLAVVLADELIASRTQPTGVTPDETKGGGGTRSLQAIQCLLSRPVLVLCIVHVYER